MATVVDNLSCICGNKTVCKSVVEVDGMMVNQLYCYECGIIMRSPASIDVDGTWLIKHWHEIHERKTERTAAICHTCQAWLSGYLCSEPESDYFGYGTSSKFGCDAWH